MAASNSGEHNPDSVETLASGSIIELDEVLEGDHIVSRNYCFAPVGANIPIGADFRYDPEAPPSQPLAVSQRFHLLFVAHSDGFCVVRTKEAIAAAKKIKEESNGLSIQEICTVYIPLGKVSILALSSGDSLLAASVENQLHFFSISTLLYKEQKPSYSVSLDESVCVKGVKWARKAEKTYLVLSSAGKLYHGSGQGTLKSVMVNVDAVEWSAKGDLVAVARKNVLSILSPELVEKFSVSLSLESLIVDSIRWPRPDCIVLGCFATDDDSEEENYLVQVITSKDKEITDKDDDNSVLALSFDKASHNDELKFLLGKEEKEVSPCGVLICLTIDGKLALFHFASAVGSSVSSEVLADSVGEENASHKLLSQHKAPVVSTSKDLEECEKKVGLSLPAMDASRSEIIGGREVSAGNNQPSASFQSFTQEQKRMLNIQTLKDDEQQKLLPIIKLNQDRFILPSISPEKSGPNSEQSSFRSSQLVDPEIVGRNASETKTQEFAEAIPHADYFSGKLLTDLSSQPMSKSLQTLGGVQYPEKAVPPKQETAPSFSWSSGKATSAKSTNERSSTTGSIDKKSSGNSLHFAGDLFQHPSKIKETAGLSVPINSSGQQAPAVAGNVYGSSQMLQQKNMASGKSSKIRFNEENSISPLQTGLASFEQSLPKQFRNVEDMAKKMVRLLEGIERIGGFKDGCFCYVPEKLC